MANPTIADQRRMISRLFFSLLPVQVTIMAMGSINSIADGVVAARYIDASSVGVIGLYYTMVRVLEGAGAILLGGVSVLCGRSLGAGKMDESRGICSLGTAAALAVGMLLTGLGLFAPNAIARALGADSSLTDALATYVRGYAFGIIPQLLAQQLAAVLQLEGQDKRGQIGGLVMIGVNVALDILFVAIFKMGLWGLALATSLANWAYFLVVGTYFLGEKSNLKPDIRSAHWRILPELLKTGFPNALLVFCLAVRSLVVNRILLAYAGQDGLSALSAFNMICGLIIAVALGTGAVVRILSSVFIGEENREDLSALIYIAFTKAMLLTAVMTVLVVACAPLIGRIFFPDTASSVYGLTRQLFTIYGFCIPAVLVCQIIANYCQALGHRRFVVIVSLADGFFSFIIPAALLAPLLGAFGVWLAFPIGLLLTLLVCILHVRLFLGHWPRSRAECLMLPEGFGAIRHLVLTLHSMEQVPRIAEQVQIFCESSDMTKKTAYHVALCLEELALNIVCHGFSADKKPHWVEIRVAFCKEGVLLRVKDDCIPFNVQEWHDISVPEDPIKNVGIRLVHALAGIIEYQSLLGMNILSITIA